MTKRLYVVVRADLPPGLQMAQACHAVREFTLQYPKIDVGENLVVLHAADELELECLMWRADNSGFPYMPFREPDLDNEMTACAFTGRSRGFLGALPLAMRAPRDSPDLSVLTA